MVRTAHNAAATPSINVLGGPKQITLWFVFIEHTRLRPTIASTVFYNPAVLRALYSRLAVILAVAAIAAGQTKAQAPVPENTPKSSDPALVTCGDKPPYATRTVRGDTLITTDGKRRAYAETEATVLTPQPTPGHSNLFCVNNSRIFVAVDTGDYKLRYLQEPADIESGNTIRLVDWSSDGRRLLAELAEWQYEQPGATFSVLIFDARNGTFQQPDLARALAKTFSRECSANIRVLGFTAKGSIALEAQPLTPEEEEVQGVLSCSRNKSYFEMDRATETLVSVPDIPKLQHNAKSEPPAK